MHYVCGCRTARGTTLFARYCLVTPRPKPPEVGFGAPRVVWCRCAAWRRARLWMGLSGRFLALSGYALGVLRTLVYVARPAGASLGVADLGAISSPLREVATSWVASELEGFAPHRDTGDEGFYGVATREAGVSRAGEGAHAARHVRCLHEGSKVLGGARGSRSLAEWHHSRSSSVARLPPRDARHRATLRHLREDADLYHNGDMLSALGVHVVNGWARSHP